MHLRAYPRLRIGALSGSRIKVPKGYTFHEEIPTAGNRQGTVLALTYRSSSFLLERSMFELHGSQNLPLTVSPGNGLIGRLPMRASRAVRLLTHFDGFSELPIPMLGANRATAAWTS